jgi:hypothetical protein
MRWKDSAWRLARGGLDTLADVKEAGYDQAEHALACLACLESFHQIWLHCQGQGQHVEQRQAAAPTGIRVVEVDHRCVAARGPLEALAAGATAGCPLRVVGRGCGHHGGLEQGAGQVVRVEHDGVGHAHHGHMHVMHEPDGVLFERLARGAQLRRGA